MIKLFVIPALAILLTLVACGQDKPTMKFDGTTDSGYPYIMHQDKEGVSPNVGDRIRYSRQIRLGYDSIISPRTQQAVLLPERIQMPKPAPADYELILKMSPGDSASVYVFGEQLKAIPNSVREPDDTIIYDIVVMEIIETAAQRESVMNKSDEAEGRVNQFITGNKKRLFDNTIITTASGLKVFHIKEGSGIAAVPGNQVEVHYCGLLEDKTVFDNSFGKGDPINFKLGANQVIQGWEEGIALIKKGGSAILVVPPSLAYGERGKAPFIPSNATLYFYVEVTNVF